MLLIVTFEILTEVCQPINNYCCFGNYHVTQQNIPEDLIVMLNIILIWSRRWMVWYVLGYIFHFFFENHVVDFKRLLIAFLISPGCKFYSNFCWSHWLCRLKVYVIVGCAGDENIFFTLVLLAKIPPVWGFCHMLFW